MLLVTLFAPGHKLSAAAALDALYYFALAHQVGCVLGCGCVLTAGPGGTGQRRRPPRPDALAVVQCACAARTATPSSLAGSLPSLDAPFHVPPSYPPTVTVRWCSGAGPQEAGSCQCDPTSPARCKLPLSTVASKPLASPFVPFCPQTPYTPCHPPVQADFDVRWCRGAVGEKLLDPFASRLQAMGGKLLGGRRVTGVVPPEPGRRGRWVGGWAARTCDGTLSRLHMCLGHERRTVPCSCVAITACDDCDLHLIPTRLIVSLSHVHYMQCHGVGCWRRLGDLRGGCSGVRRGHTGGG